MSRTLNPQLFGPTESPVIKVDTSGIAQKKLRDIENQVEVLQQKLDRMTQVHEAKFQHLVSLQKNLESQMRHIAETFSKQNAQIVSRISEKRGADVKVQDLIDRHQQLVTNFEHRLGQIHKVTKDQEVKILAYKATYDEVLKEIRNIHK